MVVSFLMSIWGTHTHVRNAVQMVLDYSSDLQVAVIRQEM